MGEGNRPINEGSQRRQVNNEVQEKNRAHSVKNEGKHTSEAGKVENEAGKNEERKKYPYRKKASIVLKRANEEGASNTKDVNGIGG